jgi:hypothetical protein
VRLGRARREAGGLLYSKPAIREAERHHEDGEVGPPVRTRDVEDWVFARNAPPTPPGPEGSNGNRMSLWCKESLVGVALLSQTLLARTKVSHGRTIKPLAE